jgi:hypothetical protein
LRTESLQRAGVLQGILPRCLSSRPNGTTTESPCHRAAVPASCLRGFVGSLACCELDTALAEQAAARKRADDAAAADSDEDEAPGDVDGAREEAAAADATAEDAHAALAAAQAEVGAFLQ